MINKETCGTCKLPVDKCKCVENNIGTKNDFGKLRWDLMPMEQVEKITEIITFGSIKYSPGNWKKIDMPRDRYYAALMRHLQAWKHGELIDKDSGKTHLSHLGCNLLFLMWMDEHCPEKMKINNDPDTN